MASASIIRLDILRFCFRPAAHPFMVVPHNMLSLQATITTLYFVAFLVSLSTIMTVLWKRDISPADESSYAEWR